MSDQSHTWNHSTGICETCTAHRSEMDAMLPCPVPMAGSKTHKMPFVTEFLRSSADIYAERNAVYKDNYKMVGRIMKAMFPDGIKLVTEEDHNKFHLFMLAIVKLSRYAVNYEKGHEPSVEDLIVYMAMVQALDNEAKATQNGQGG